MTDNRVPNETQRSLTIREFCAIEKRLGRGPQVMRIVGNIVRISPEARREWHTRMTAFAQKKEASLNGSAGWNSRVAPDKRPPSTRPG